MDGIGYPNFKRTWPIYHILGYFICIRIISLQYILKRLLVINGHEYNPILAGSQLQPQSSLLLQGAAPPPARSSFPHAAQWRQIVRYNLSSMAMNSPWPDIPWMIWMVLWLVGLRQMLKKAVNIVNSEGYWLVMGRKQPRVPESQEGINHWNWASLDNTGSPSLSPVRWPCRCTANMAISGSPRKAALAAWNAELWICTACRTKSRSSQSSSWGAHQLVRKNRKT